MESSPNLCTLPLELQHHIALNLHPSAAIALKQTNRYFHTHISLYKLDPLKVKRYLHEVQLRPRHRDSYACFTCLRVRPMSAFTASQLDVKTRNHRTYPYERYCLDCGVENKSFRPGTILIMAGDQAHSRVFCGSCSTVQSYFCGKCHWCAPCIARTKAFKMSWSKSLAIGLCQGHLQGMSGLGIGRYRASTSSLGF